MFARMEAVESLGDLKAAVAAWNECMGPFKAKTMGVWK